MTEKQYHIKAPSRLHFGFLDLHGGVGSYFGSIGMALANPVLELYASKTNNFSVTGDASERIQHFAQIFFQKIGIQPGISITSKQIIPEHHGLGSGTQIALAVGHIISHFYKMDWDSMTIAKIIGRGKRSGIGIGAFMQGGFLVDAGKLEEKEIPLVTTRLAVPSAWRVILIRNKESNGIHGIEEKKAFEQLPEFSQNCAGQLSRLVLMGILPALVRHDCKTFSASLLKFQDMVGDYFSTIQKERYADPKVSEVLHYIRQQCGKGVGQSSWGPTGFVFMPDQDEAIKLLNLIQQHFPEDFGITLDVSCADNQGMQIK